MQSGAVDRDPLDRTEGDLGALLGTIGAGGRARIDRRGVIAPEDARWSMDWWVGAEDRWHIASDGALVRQSLVDAAPVVLSALRLPGGEIEQRAWAAIDGGGAPVLIVDLHNATSVPVALAAAFTAAPGPTSTIDLVDQVVTIDGRPAARFSRLPSRFGFASTDRSAREVTVAGEAMVEFPDGGVHDADGAVTVAFVFPLPHTATLRVVVPLDSALDVDDLVRLDPANLPPVDRVVAGWRSQLARAPRFELPERGVEAAIDVARCHLLVQVGADRPMRSFGVPVDGIDRAEMTMALSEQGLFVEAERLLLSAVEEQASDGSFDSDRLDATAGWLIAAARHVALTDSESLAVALVEPVVAAAHWLSQRQRNRLRRSRSFFSGGTGPAGMTSPDRIARDARLTRRAFGAAIDLLDLVGERDAALAVRLHLVALEEAMALRSISESGPGDGRRSPEPLAQFRADLLAGEPLWTWPSASDGHDPARTAQFLRGARALVVDDGGTELDLLPGFGDLWLGQPVAVHRLPTSAGTLSFALRWHGARPALLWDLEGDRPSALTCTSIDASWSSDDRRGEALLSAPVLDHDHSPAIEIASSGAAPVSDPRSVAEPPLDAGGSFS